MGMEKRRNAHSSGESSFSKPTMTCCENPIVLEDGRGVHRCVTCGEVRDEEETGKECCASPVFATDNAEGCSVCTNCGFVKEEGIIQEDMYNDVFDPDKARVSLHGGGGIVKGYAASRWNMSVLTTRDKISMCVDTFINTYDLKPVVKDLVLGVFDNVKVTGSGMWRGKKLETIAAALVYLALRDTQNRRTVSEISSMIEDPVKKLNGAIKFLRARVERSSSSARIDPETMVARYTSRLGLPREVVVCAQSIIRKNFAHTCMSIDSLVAASIYVACLRRNVDISISSMSSMFSLNVKTIENAAGMIHSPDSLGATVN